MSSRDDLDAYVVQLERENHRLRCEIRRVCEDLDYAHERERVLRRVIERLGADDDADRPR